jgi:uncharacterized protein
MKHDSSRRGFLAAGLGMPAVALGSFQAGSPGSAAAPKDSGLRYRILGKTGLKLTTVGFGCMVTSDGSVIERAADAGINYFDTARGYQGGNNERMVGAALRARRKQLHISTKSHARDKAGALAELETSLKELGTDYVDVWYLHSLTSPSDLNDETIGALVEAKKQGKTRFVGASLHGNHLQLIPALAARPEVDVILSSYNFTLDAAVTKAIADASKAGKGTVAMKVMAGGFRRPRPDDPNQQKLKRDGAMLAALKWAIRNPEVNTSIPSITDLDQLEENFQAMTNPISEKEHQLLAQHNEFIRPLYCRTCGSCTGVCPEGLQVSEIVRYLSYAEGYGQFGLGRTHFQLLPAAQQQVRCQDCTECTIKCPNGVHVRERLMRAQELFA